MAAASAVRTERKFMFKTWYFGCPACLLVACSFALEAQLESLLAFSGKPFEVLESVGKCFSCCDCVRSYCVVVVLLALVLSRSRELPLTFEFVLQLWRTRG